MTLIDKAEAHDDDLIRRGDALKKVDEELRRYGFTAPEGRRYDMRDAIAALPARGVGEAYEAGLQTALGLIGSIGYGKNEDVDRGHEEAFAAVAKHLQDLRDAKSAALAPTDAAQAREAALQAERDAPDYRLAPDLQRIADRAKTAPHWDTENDRLAVPDRKPVWPDFIAPPKYDNPDPRWVDPALPDFRLIWKIARECGYAVGLHGSMKRDCDLIAVPWTDEAVLAFDLIYRLCEALHAQILGPVAGKPHGRLGWILQVDGYVKVIDISVVPRSQDRATPALKRIGTGLYETAFTPSAIRDAALREAAAIVEEEIRQAKQYFPPSVPILRGVSDRILALIGEARDD